MVTPRYPWRRGNNNKNMKSSLKCLMRMTELFEDVQLQYVNLQIKSIFSLAVVV